MRRLILACLLLAASPGVAFAQGRDRQPEWIQAREERINVSLGRIEPGVIRLRAGEPTRLVFYNSGRARLGVAAGRFFAMSRLRSGQEMLAMRGGLVISPGVAREVVLVPARGRYRLRSTSLYRRLLGMSAQIIVE